MKMRNANFNVLALGLGAVGAIVVVTTATAGDRRSEKKGAQAKPAAKAQTAADVLRSWPPGPQLAGQEMMVKYGPPAEVTSERMIWRDAGPFKRIMLTKEELPHDFPLPHMDYLEHTISFKVPNDKADDVHAFDASMTIYGVAGELSARCDLESNNVLTLNLAKDVIDGKKSVAEARKEFGDLVMQRTLGKNPPYTAAMQFQPQSHSNAADVEATTIPGSPKRVATAEQSGGDAEILAMLVALDHDEVHAAMVAKEKAVRGPVMDYAKMLHEHHGNHVQETARLGQQIKTVPAQTPAVRALHAKHAGALAKIVPLDGDAFARAFLDLMVQGHTEALGMLDRQVNTAKRAEVKTHLTKTRETIATHLQAAKRLQERNSTQTSSR